MQPADIIAIGPPPTIPNLLDAYSNGIFPWPDPSYPEMIWASPIRRGILHFDAFKPNSRLLRTYKSPRWRYTIDQAFQDVLENCAVAHRPNQSGTWITPKIKHAYLKFFEAGHTHSIEVWEENDLIAGLYGVNVAGYFAGESMFAKRNNASKCALIYLIDHLKDRGAAWMDIQQLTPHMAALGATEIPRADFLQLVHQAKQNNLTLF